MPATRLDRAERRTRPRRTIINDARDNARPYLAQGRAVATEKAAAGAALAAEAAASARDAAAARVSELKGQPREEEGRQVQEAPGPHRDRRPGRVRLQEVHCKSRQLAVVVHAGAPPQACQPAPTSASTPRNPRTAPPSPTTRRGVPRRGDRRCRGGAARGDHARRPRCGGRYRGARRAQGLTRGADSRTTGRTRTPAGRESFGRCSAIQSSMDSHQLKSHSIRASRPVGSPRGTCHHRMMMTLSMGSSRQRSPTVSRWSRPVCATSTTSASGAASRAASSPPGRGASTWIIASARNAIRSRPSFAAARWPVPCEPG